MQRLRVAIAGFGIAGGALATLLARARHAVTLFEQAPKLGPVGAGFLLQPSGQRVLSDLGLLSPVVRQAEPISGLRAFTHRGGTLIELGYPEGEFAYGVRRSLVFEALADAAREAGARIELGRRILGWQEEPDGVVALDAEGPTRESFDLLIAADGARSVLRDQVAPGEGGHDDPYGALWTVGTSDQVRGYLYQVTRGTRRLSGLLPLGEGACNFFWGLAGRVWEALRRRPFTAFRDTVLRLNPMAESILDQRDDWSAYTFGTYRHCRPRTIQRGRVVLVGDAAHATTPHLGQGANLALLDAASLANALEESSDLPLALARHASERRSQTRYYGQLSSLLSPFFQSDWVPLGWARDLGLHALSRIGPVRRRMEQTLAGDARGWFS